MAGQGSQVGSAHISIFPVMTGFKAAVSKEVRSAGSESSGLFSKIFKGTGTKSGAQLGREMKAAFKSSAGGMGSSVLSTFKRDVASATAKTVKSMNQMRDAQGRVRVATSQLADAQRKYGEGSTQVIAAEERLASARRKLDAVTASHKGNIAQLTAAHKALRQAEDEVNRASQPGIFTMMGSAISGLASKITGPAVTALNGFRTTASSAFGSVTSTVTNAARGIFSKLPASVQGDVTKAFSGITGIAGKAMGGLRTTVSGAAGHIGSAFRAAGSAGLGAIKVMATGIAASAATAGAAVIAVGKQALSSYASYEQLVGGVDTLFKDASSTVQQYAANAYKTAGVSANTYMEQATAFSASLLQGLGGDTQKAADYADLAIRDMSDNANKMGTSIDSVQQTYQSLMRGNYAMLDNLKLGYGGTKSELERLVSDASKLTGQALDPAKFSDVITAIHAVQESMGITGTTALEASTTIEGSVGSMKAAWSNWLAEMGKGNADMGKLTAQLVETVATAAGNILPRLVTIAGNLFTTLTSGAKNWMSSDLPARLNQFQAWVTANLPTMMERGMDMLGSVANGIMANMPKITESAISLVATAGGAILQRLPEIITWGVRMLGGIVTGILNSLPKLIAAAPVLIGNLASSIAANLPTVVSAGVRMLSSVASGFGSAVPQIIGQIPGIVSRVWNAFTSVNWGQVGLDIIRGIGSGIARAAGSLVGSVVDAAKGALNSVKGFLGIHSPSRVFRDQVGRYIPEGMAVGIRKAGPSVVSAMGGVADAAVERAKTARAAISASVGAVTASGGIGSAPGETVNNYIFNQPVKTPYETARAIRMEQRYGIAAA